MRVEGRPPHRNTKSYEVFIGGLNLVFSYSTCVAMYYHPLGLCGRLDNRWGPTTGRHLKEMGAWVFPVVESHELEAMVEQAIQHMGMESFKNTLQGKKAA